MFLRIAHSFMAVILEGPATSHLKKWYGASIQSVVVWTNTSLHWQQFFAPLAQLLGEPWGPKW